MIKDSNVENTAVVMAISWSGRVVGVVEDIVVEKEVGRVEEMGSGVKGTVWVVALFVVREGLLFELEGNWGWVLLRCLIRAGGTVRALVERERRGARCCCCLPCCCFFCRYSSNCSRREGMFRLVTFAECRVLREFCTTEAEK